MNKLSKDFTILSLLKFTAPTCLMLVFMSMYQMVDAVFVSNYVGESALSAINIVFPIPSIVIAISIMLATGGSAVIAKNMGEGKNECAKQNFSMIVSVGFIFGIIFSIGCLFTLSSLVKGLGATDILFDYCYDYLYLLLLATPLMIVQMLFQTFFVTAGLPQLGLAMTGLGGVINVVFDYLFIVVYKMGIVGAALATSMGYVIPAILGIIYFLCYRNGTLYFVKHHFDFNILMKVCLNGSSEMVTNFGLAIVTFMFNFMMLSYVGENGVAAITIVLYAQFLLTSIFMGFTGGVAPIFSYNYGNKNNDQIKNIFKMCIQIVLVFSVLMFVCSLIFAKPLIAIFSNEGSAVFDLTYHGMLLFSISFLFTGINIFASGLFTAFSNGKISALLSFVRTCFLLIVSLIVLPLILDVDGIWLAVPVAEFISLFLSIYYLLKNRELYHY